MLDKIIFYNFFHNGDIHVSRTLVKWVSENVEAKEYEYHHNNSESLLADLPKIKYKKLELDWSFHDKGWFIKNNILYGNTWYHAYNAMFSNEGMTLINLYKSFSKGMLDSCGKKLSENILEYLPSIDFSFINKDAIDKNIPKNDNLIFIANCEPLSGSDQSTKDIDSMILETINMFPNAMYLITNPTKIRHDNMIMVENIVERSWDNLNELSYVSTFCKVIVGVGSGPQTFSLIDVNLLDSNKKFINYVNFDECDFGISRLTNKHAEFIKFK